MDIWIAIGLAFVVWAALVQAFAWTAVQAALIVGLACIVIGVINSGVIKRS